MNLRLLSLLVLLGAFVALTILPIHSKAWTVEQRQTKLMQDVNAGQKSGELTDKQSRKLRKNLANVARKKAKMKNDGDGKISSADKIKLQSKIDKTSSKIKEEKQKED